MASLSNLSGSLTRLSLESCDIPAGLSALTRLQHLLLCECEAGEEYQQAIDGALPHLQQLTFLVMDAACPPAALSGLSRLQRCYLARYDDPFNPGAAHAPLPAGPWLRSLRWLGASLGNLINSVGMLRHAVALEYLDCGTIGTQDFDWLSPPVATFFDWLAQHPSLERVSIHGSSPLNDSPAFAFLVALLRQQRPDLHVCSRFAPDSGPSMYSILVPQDSADY